MNVFAFRHPQHFVYFSSFWLLHRLNSICSIQLNYWLHEVLGYSGNDDEKRATWKNWSIISEMDELRGVGVQIQYADSSIGLAGQEKYLFSPMIAVKNELDFFQIEVPWWQED